ncbi:hypothetical protein IFT79_07145 [Frigoribacterium sp. CFBP 8759]|uniref:hypothetical protein n=1 Tax=Frigoribacterium sp. CFBP 8759 TaxID=2775283 RepID=UPI0017831270|nr:hypothetical protein [Frigoribacterium sp. CFBP 8759]MBD8485387.1 hypothetical protein [Frigoribacterium sp. CFBP 8759]
MPWLPPDALAPPAASEAVSTDAAIATFFGGLSEQQKRLIGIAIEVDIAALSKRTKEVAIHEDEAAYLAELPFELTRELSNLAIARARMTNSQHLQRGDIDWAAARILTGRRNSRLLPFANSVGGLIAGIGTPFIWEAASSTEASSPADLLFGLCFTVPGIILFSIGATLSLSRRS